MHLILSLLYSKSFLLPTIVKQKLSYAMSYDKLMGRTCSEQFIFDIILPIVSVRNPLGSNYSKEHRLSHHVGMILVFTILRWRNACNRIWSSYDGSLQMIWQIPDIQHELLWDYGMCADTSHGAAIRELINRALKGALAPT